MMATVQRTHSRTLALGVVLLVAKLTLVIVARRPLSPWAPIALLHQDVWLLALFLPIDRFGRRAAWVVYGAIVLWVAINVPVARVFGTPLTAGMLRAAGGALKDSIVLYVTLSNVLAVAAVVAAGVMAPRIRWSKRGALGFVAIALLIVALGPLSLRRVETLGLHRNAVVAVARTWMQRAVRSTDSSVVAAPIVPEGNALDLTHLAGAARGKSVLWVVLESTGARYLRPYGAARDTMPNVSALAERGVTFSSAYTVYPESIKGLWAAMCSRAIAPHTNAEAYATAPCTSIADVLKGAGYRTAMLHSGRFAYLGMDSVVEKRGFDALEDAAKIPAKNVASFGIDDASTARRAVAWANESKEPFFLMYLPIGGHHPYETPGEGPRPFPETDDFSRYQNDLFRSDHALGILLEGLRGRDVVVVVNGDHGEAFFQHEGNFAHTLMIYEENVHVPLIVSVPGVTTSAIRAPQIASLLDIPPTIAELVGVPAPAAWEGRSLLQPRPRVARFFADQATFLLGLRDGKYKAIHDPEASRTKLFDLASDPMETHDLSATDPARAQRYREHLLAWSASR